MFIRNRFDRDGNTIDDPAAYIPQNTEELEELLTGIYSEIIANFDRNKEKIAG